MNEMVMLRPVAGYNYRICEHITFGGEPAIETKSDVWFTIGLDCKVCNASYYVKVIDFFYSESKHPERKDWTDEQGTDKPSILRF